MAVLHRRIDRHQYPQRRQKGEEIIWIHLFRCVICWAHSIQIQTISSQFLKISITIKAKKGYKMTQQKSRGKKEDQRVQCPKVHGMCMPKALAMVKYQSQERGEIRSLNPTYWTFLSIPTPQSSHSIRSPVSREKQSFHQSVHRRTSFKWILTKFNHQKENLYPQCQ